MTQEFIDVVAIERGFYDGHLVEPGASVRFPVKDADGKAVKLPKWLVEKGKEPAKAAAPKQGDIRPQAAQDAAKKKAGQFAGDNMV